MKNSDELRDELENSPFLKKMKAQPGEGFKVPGNYFQHLPDQVLKQVKQEPAPVPSRQGWQERFEQFLNGLFQPNYALALASVLLLVVASVIFFKEKNASASLQPMAEVSLADISDEELFAYVSNNIGDFDRNLVLEASGPELPEMKQQPKFSLPKTNAPKPDLEEMEKYLDEVIEEINVEDLEEML